MRSSALRVERGEAERVRRVLAAQGWLRGDLRPLREGSTICFPVQNLPDPLPQDVQGMLAEEEFPPSQERGPQDYRELVELPGELRASLPSSFDVVGDLVLIRLPDELLPRREEIGAALLRFVPGCRKVGLDRGVEGVTRVRSLLAIAGDGDWTTTHRENGLSFRVDLERAYFSPRLAHEHERVARQVAPGERLLDLCCGIGPFALTALRFQSKATAVAVDLNPVAVELLRENAHRLGVEDRLETIEASAEEYLCREERFTRAVLNLPREGYKYATSVAHHIMPAGTLHYYEVARRDQVPLRAEALSKELTALGGGPWTVEDPRVVHAFSPTSDLIAWTLHRGA